MSMDAIIKVALEETLHATFLFQLADHLLVKCLLL